MNGTPTIGHNRPDAIDALADRTGALIATANAWLDQCDEIANEDQAAQCKDFMQQLGDEAKVVEAERKAQKAPHIAAGRLVDAAYSPLKIMLDKARDLLEPKVRAWLKKEQDRLDAIARADEAEAMAKTQAEQEAQRRAAEANTVEAAVEAEGATKAAADAALIADRAAKARAGTKGQFGGRAMTIRKTRKIIVEDVMAVAAQFQDSEDLHDLLARLATAAIKEGREIAGIRFEIIERAA
jgi:hypothetical protein